MRSFGIVRAHASVFFWLAFVFTGLPAVVGTVFVVAITAALRDTLMPFLRGTVAFTPDIHRSLGLLLAFLALLLVASVVFVAAQVGITKATLDAYAGRPVSFRASLRVPARAYVSSFVASTTLWSLVSLGAVCCCLPAIPLLVVFAFALPFVLERGDHGLASMRSSYHLARRHGTTTALVSALLILGWLVAYAAEDAGSRGFFESLPTDAPWADSITSPQMLVGTTLLGTVAAITTMFQALIWQVVPAVLYARLTTPDDPEELARVFA